MADSPYHLPPSPRMMVCNQVMKFILDKMEKDEKQAAKKRKKEEVVEQKRSKQNATKLTALLYKHKEQLKAEILKKRALLDKELQLQVQVGDTAPPRGPEVTKRPQWTGGQTFTVRSHQKAAQYLRRNICEFACVSTPTLPSPAGWGLGGRGRRGAGSRGGRAWAVLWIKTFVRL